MEKENFGFGSFSVTLMLVNALRCLESLLHAHGQSNNVGSWENICLCNSSAFQEACRMSEVCICKDKNMKNETMKSAQKENFAPIVFVRMLEKSIDFRFSLR